MGTGYRYTSTYISLLGDCLIFFSLHIFLLPGWGTQVHIISLQWTFHYTQSILNEIYYRIQSSLNLDKHYATETMKSWCGSGCADPYLPLTNESGSESCCFRQ
jgi:hypothetical protein